MTTALFHGRHDERHLVFWCPGCDMPHSFRVVRDATRPKDPCWAWNGDRARPTCTPSLVINTHTPAKRCHLFLTAGTLRFLGDCFHALKGQTVPLPDLPADF